MAFGVFPEALFLPLATTAFRGSQGYSSLAIIAFGAFEVGVAKYCYRLGEMDKSSLDSLNLRRLRSSRFGEPAVAPRVPVVFIVIFVTSANPQARKKSTKINFLGSGDRPVGWGSSTRRGGGRKLRARPRKFVFLGFRREESVMSREFCRDVPDPWGCSKSLCKKTPCALIVR